MKKVKEKSKVTTSFEFSWDSWIGKHKENYLCKINMWRDWDVMPAKLRENLIGKKVGDEFNLNFKTGELFKYDEGNIFEVPYDSFRPVKPFLFTVKPKIGRFYPLGFFGGLANVFPENMNPARVVDIYDSKILIDINNPVAKYDINLKGKIIDIIEIAPIAGGECRAWCNMPFEYGPGMQVPVEGKSTDFEIEKRESFLRADETDDEVFYKEPRFTYHIDRQCHANLVELYRKVIPANSKVIDLMSSYESHLPEELNLEITGLGLNAEEMKNNKMLKDFIVKDINKEPVLPFPDETFDWVVCDLSVEYITHPVEIANEIARVLKKDGKVSFSFSNRYFPPKVIRLWIDLHEFERMGYVIEILRKTNKFTDFVTYSYRGWRRPYDDKYFGCTLFSDPLYVVIAKKI